MRILLFILFLVSPLTITAQVIPQTLYYSEARVVVTPGAHYIFRKALVDTVNFTFEGPFKDFYRDGTLLVSGRYDKNEKTGPFQLFYRTGELYAEGEYDEGQKSGVWNYYYPDGHLMDKILVQPLFY